MAIVWSMTSQGILPIGQPPVTRRVAPPGRRAAREQRGRCLLRSTVRPVAAASNLPSYCKTLGPRGPRFGPDWPGDPASPARAFNFGTCAKVKSSPPAAQRRVFAACGGGLVRPEQRAGQARPNRPDPRAHSAGGEFDCSIEGPHVRSASIWIRRCDRNLLRLAWLAWR
jgi:hypothetical protein